MMRLVKYKWFLCYRPGSSSTTKLRKKKSKRVSFLSVSYPYYAKLLIVVGHLFFKISQHNDDDDNEDDIDNDDGNDNAKKIF